MALFDAVTVTHLVTYAVVTPAGMVKLAAMLEGHFGTEQEVA